MWRRCIPTAVVVGRVRGQQAVAQYLDLYIHHLTYKFIDCVFFSCVVCATVLKEWCAELVCDRFCTDGALTHIALRLRER